MRRVNWLSSVLVISAMTSLSFPAVSILVGGLGISDGSALGAAVTQKHQKSFLDILFGHKTGRGGSRAPFCSIWPNLDDPELREIWNNRPLFIWKTKANVNVKRIEVFIPGREPTLWWSHDITGNKQHGSSKESGASHFGKDNSWMIQSVPYTGRPLEIGKDYDYRVTYEIINEKGEIDVAQTSYIPFSIKDAETYSRIQMSLDAIGSQHSGMSPEEMTLKRAEVFVQEGLWSDFLQEIFSVSNPSRDLTNLTEKIRTEPECTVKPESGN